MPMPDPRGLASRSHHLTAMPSTSAAASMCTCSPSGAPPAATHCRYQRAAGEASRQLALTCAYLRVQMEMGCDGGRVAGMREPNPHLLHCAGHTCCTPLGFNFAMHWAWRRLPQRRTRLPPGSRTLASPAAPASSHSRPLSLLLLNPLLLTARLPCAPLPLAARALPLPHGRHAAMRHGMRQGRRSRTGAARQPATAPVAVHGRLNHATRASCGEPARGRAVAGWFGQGGKQFARRHAGGRRAGLRRRARKSACLLPPVCSLLPRQTRN